ncbi:endonuclease/exonuclease/phosphatase family protein [Vibrio lamellibrachiae]|uniref:endonuclease/exonuclease/phosphatase family protein n=1 Tax=Vibrio lamellibrachiae TaxID=2910253 RepID=UPI003D0B21B6
MTISFQKLKICTINLFNYVEPPNAFYDFANIYTTEEWQIKTRWLAKTVERIDADIIGFQEVFSIDALKDTMLTLGYQHFVTVDMPDIEQDYIYSNPVLAIASRYPIEDVQPITLSSPVANHNAGFEFSRSPIHAVIDIPKLGAIDVYVVHFKSQRPSELVSSPDSADPSLTEQWLAENQGKWLSTMQRGMEVHVLHQHLVETKQKQKRPCVLMGDFNQSLYSPEFYCLVSKHLFRKKESAETLKPFHMYNSRDITLDESSGSHSPTYYVGAEGKELDYILLSSEFSSCSNESLAVVNHYHVEDSHIVNPRYGIDHVSSDHGIVTVDISII